MVVVAIGMGRDHRRHAVVAAARMRVRGSAVHAHPAMAHPVQPRFLLSRSLRVAPLRHHPNLCQLGM